MLKGRQTNAQKEYQYLQFYDFERCFGEDFYIARCRSPIARQKVLNEKYTFDIVFIYN